MKIVFFLIFSVSASSTNTLNFILFDYTLTYKFLLIELLLQVMDDDRKVARGVILSEELKQDTKAIDLPCDTERSFEFNCDDVYQLLLEREYHYK